MSKIRDTNLQVLIVDDNPQYILLLTRLLESVFGYKNITALQEIDKAFQLIASDPDKFGLMFVDYCFPSGESGGDFLEKLHNAGYMKDKTAFLVTAEPTVDNLKQAQRAGAVGVVAKPFDRHELKKQLEKAERLQTIDEAGSF